MLIVKAESEKMVNHQFKNAIVRIPGPDFANGITTSELGIPDYHKMLVQHKAYIETLKNLELEVTVLPEEGEFPDAHFVEDTAVIFPEAAIVTNPGHPARQGEEQSILQVLEQFRKIHTIESPGTVDGGDVLLVDKFFYIGISARTNVAGIRQFDRIVTQYDYTCVAVPVDEGLHLKSSVNFIGNNTLLMTADFAYRSEFDSFEKIVLDEEESYSCNTLLINDVLLTPAGFPAVREKLKITGLPVIELDMSEVQKMDGGLTCLSLRF